MWANTVETQQCWEVFGDDRPQPGFDVGDLSFEEPDPLGEHLQRDPEFLLDKIVVAGAEADRCIQLVTERLGRKHVTELVRSTEHHRLELIDRLDAIMSSGLVCGLQRADRLDRAITGLRDR